MTIEEKKKQQVHDLLAAVRKYTKGSAGIDNFENLLGEVNNYWLTSAVIKNLNKFIEDFVITVRDIDQMKSKSLQAKILTYDFLCVEKYFKETNKEMENVVKRLRFLNIAYGEKRHYDFSRTSIIGNFNTNFKGSKSIKAPDGYNKFSFTLVVDDEAKKFEFYEQVRKEFLLWNYIPVVVKAIIMTKRRSLGFDTNSTRF